MTDKRSTHGPPQRERKPYQAPSLTEYGEVRKITAGQETGSALDETFPTGTPFEDLTFS